LISWKGRTVEDADFGGVVDVEVDEEVEDEDVAEEDEEEVEDADVAEEDEEEVEDEDVDEEDEEEVEDEDVDEEVDEEVDTGVVVAQYITGRATYCCTRLLATEAIFTALVVFVLRA